MNRQVQQPDVLPPITINLNDYHDTIQIGTVTNFIYAISGTDNKILSVEISIDGVMIHQYLADNMQSFSFNLDPSSFTDGQYALHVAVITTSGTGSIAEKLGAEGYLYELDWPVVIDKTYPSGPYTIHFEKVHDPEGVKLTWESFDHANFTSYAIYRQYKDVQQQPEAIAFIDNSMQSSFIDHGYWEGQDATYFIRIYTPNGFYDGSNCLFTDQLTGLTATWHTNGMLDVSWEPARNLESFSGYSVFISYADTPMETILIRDLQENHTSFPDAGVGYGINIYLAVVPTGLDPGDIENLKFAKYTHYSPSFIPSYFLAHRVNNHSFMLLSTQNKVYRYYPDYLTSDDTLDIDLNIMELITVSTDGNRFAYFDGSSFFVRGTDDFHLIKTFSDPSIPYPESINSLSLSDNGRLIATDGWNNVYLYDIETGALIRKDTIALSGLHLKTVAISPDGNNLAGVTGSNEVTYYSFGESGWNVIGTAPVMTDQICYSLDGEHIYVVTYSSVMKRRTSDFGLETEIMLPTGYDKSFDGDRERILCSQYYGPEYFIVDIRNGEVLKSLNLGYGVFALFKNHIVAAGRQLEIPEM